MVASALGKQLTWEKFFLMKRRSWWTSWYAALLGKMLWMGLSGNW